MYLPKQRGPCLREKRHSASTKTSGVKRDMNFQIKYSPRISSNRTKNRNARCHIYYGSYNHFLKIITSIYMTPELRFISAANFSLKSSLRRQL